MEKSTREIGRELENYIVSQLNNIGIKASLSKNSGCGGYNLGDINNPFAIIEAKKRNTKDITIKAEVWKKLKQSIPLHSKRFPLYVLENENLDRLAVLDLDEFISLFKDALLWRGEIND